jgi:hypothetical protein
MKDDVDDVATDTTTTRPTTTEPTTDTTTGSTTDSTEPTTDTTEPPVTDDTIDAEGEMTSVFDLEEGDCWDDPDSSASQVNEVEVLDCEQPHDNEIYYVFDLPDGDFDQDTVDSGSQDGCLSKFEDFVGISYDESKLGIFPIYPTEESWAEGDREVICSVYDIDLRKLVGSMEGEAV